MLCTPYQSIIWMIISRRRWAGHVACMTDGRGAYVVLVGKPEGKTPLERCMHRWEDNIKIILQGLGWGDMD